MDWVFYREKERQKTWFTSYPHEARRRGLILRSRCVRACLLVCACARVSEKEREIGREIEWGERERKSEADRQRQTDTENEKKSERKDRLNHQLFSRRVHLLNGNDMTRFHSDCYFRIRSFIPFLFMNILGWVAQIDMLYRHYNTTCSHSQMLVCITRSLILDMLMRGLWKGPNNSNAYIFRYYMQKT